jgi:hypothetical protein
LSADFSTRPRARESLLVPRLLIVTGSVLLAVSAGHAWRALAFRDAARRDLARVRREVQEQRARLGVLERVSGRDATVKRQVELTARAAPPRVVADIAALLPGGVLVERLVLDYHDRLELELRVEARAPLDYDRFLDALFASERLEGVLPGAESREGALASTVKAVYRPREAP